jgi:hypothetical protein
MQTNRRIALVTFALAGAVHLPILHGGNQCHYHVSRPASPRSPGGATAPPSVPGASTGSSVSSVPAGPTAPTSTSTTTVAYSVSPEQVADVARVAWCEEGGTALYRELGPWFYSGSLYPDSIGMTPANWARFGHGSDLSAASQTDAEVRFDAAYGISMPDQGAVPGVSRSSCHGY